MLWDIDALREQWASREGVPEELINYGPGENAIAEPRQPTPTSDRPEQRKFL
jgi:acetone carboxylase gamma subunit